MTIRLPAVEIEREVDQRLAKVGRTAKIKGFRPGKVPQKIVRQRFGAQVREEVLTDVIRSSYSRALAQEKLQPAGGPRIEPLDDEGDSEFVFRATFEVYPEIKLNPVGDLSVEVPAVTVTDADVDATVEKLREQRADWRAVERAAQRGDRVVVDFAARSTGRLSPAARAKKPVSRSAQASRPRRSRRRSSWRRPAISERPRSSFRRDYRVATLAGKRAHFEISVQRVEERVLPELDEAFLESLGVKEGGLEELKRGVRANLEQELGDRVSAAKRRSVLAALLAANPINAPQALVSEEIGNLQAAAMRQSGITDPAAAPARETFVDLAEQRTKMLLLVRELIREQRIELDRKRLDQRVAALVQSYDRPQEVEQYYRGNREFMAQLESTVLEEQVVDYLLEQAKTVEQPSTFEAFMGR